MGPSGQFDPQLNQLSNLFEGQGGFDLGYEIDFWGRIRRTAEAARGQLFAAEWARQTVVATLVSDVARAYFELRAFDEQLEVSQQTLASRAQSLLLVQTRQKGGVASLLDVRQAENLVESAGEAIINLQRQIEQKENEITTLLGRNPALVPRGRPLAAQLALPPVPPGLTSSLLERRPDIRQVEQELVAANAQIGAAQAQYFPQVTLTAFAGLGGNVFNNAAFGPFGIFGIAPSVNVPVFTAGRAQAGVDSASARTQAAVLRYRQTIQQAFREVADSRIGYERNRELRIQREFLVTTLRDAVRLARIRYQGGVSSYLEVLDTETRLFDAELSRVVAAAGERVAVVQLYKALGGGWQVRPPGDASVPAALKTP
ncbi:MAG: efflux transporter outer membrane subunit [Candidatus Rokuibacteriota bacterium]